MLEERGAIIAIGGLQLILIESLDDPPCHTLGVEPAISRFVVDNFFFSVGILVKAHHVQPVAAEMVLPNDDPKIGLVVLGPGEAPWPCLELAHTPLWDS